jgi:tape measure domain-containing protein
MATKVDELIVEIRAETRDLNKKLKQLRGDLDRSKTSTAGLGSALKRLGPILAALGAGAAVKGIASIGDEFERLKIALATLYGGSEGAEKAFAEINKFAQTTPFQLEDVTNAFIQLKANGIEPNVDMLTIFGDAASATLRPLESFEALVRTTQKASQGGLGIEELQQLADRGLPVYDILNKKLGITRQEVSEIGKTAAGAATLMDALSEGMQENYGGLMAAQMELLSTKISNLQIGFKQLGSEIFQSGLDKLLKSMAESATTMVEGIVRALKEARTGKPIPSFISELINEGEFEKARVALNRELDDLTAIIDTKFAKIISMKGEGFLRGLTTGPIEDDIGELQLELKNLLDALNSLPDKAPLEIKIPQLTLDQIAAIDAMKSILEDSITPLEKINALFAQLDSVTAEGIGGFSDADIERIRGHLEGLKAELNDVSETFREVMAPAIAAAAQAFTSEFVNSLMEGESALDSFKNFAKDIVGQIITTFLQMAVVNKILNGVFGLTGSNALPTMDIGARASGGSVSGGSPYLVGERGPEMFVPNSGGRIVNGHNTNNMMGGGGGVVVNQTINLSAGVVGTVRSEVQRMMPQIANVTKAGVLEATRRGGTYRRGLLGS